MKQKKEEKKEVLTPKEKKAWKRSHRFYMLLSTGIILAVIAIYLFVHNFQGGLVAIDLEEYLELNQSEERVLIYVGDNGVVSQELTPVLTKLLRESKKEAYYYEHKALDSENQMKFVESNSVTSQEDGYILPFLIVVEDQKVVASYEGYLDQESLIAFLEEEGYYALTAYDFGPMAVFDVNTRVVHVMGEEEAPAAEQPAATTTKFVDVPADAYYAAPVAWAVENGVTGGTSATTFSPKQTCRSIEILTFLWNALEKPEPTAQENPFPNADTSAYYYKPILWAYQNGVITEAEAATFDPATYCDRGEMAIYLYRAAGSPATEAATFSDVPATGELNSAVSWALANGITAGTGEDTYSPDQTCPREQIITFLYRAYH